MVEDPGTITIRGHPDRAADTAQYARAASATDLYNTLMGVVPSVSRSVPFFCFK